MGENVWGNENVDVSGWWKVNPSKSADVKRWDVYDAADHLEGISPALYRAFESKDWNEVLKLAEYISDWADKLWAMSVREGQIGPAPFYQEVK